MSKTTLVIVSALLVLDSLAMGADSTSALVQPQPNVKPLSHSTAEDWTVGCTLMPIMSGLTLAGIAKGNHALSRTAAIAALSGFVLGPAAGHAYARQTDRCIVGVMIRGVSLGLILSNSTNEGAGILGAAGVFVFLVSFGYDIGTVGASVDKYNHSHGFSNLRIRPQYFAATRVVGFNVSMSF